jgi:hypothetical protein
MKRTATLISLLTGNVLQGRLGEAPVNSDLMQHFRQTGLTRCG